MKSFSCFEFYFVHPNYLVYVGQRLHEMILKPPIAVGELLPVVSVFCKIIVI